MKQQIHAYKGHGEIAIEGHNLKLGRGGIREIEFFVQTQQLIAGGRHPQLRGRSTLAMLNVLAEGGWISAEARDDMAAAYDFLRNAEHRLQMVADEQTQTLPADREGTERFARFLGFDSRDDFAAVLGACICATCSATMSSFLRRRPPQAERSAVLLFRRTRMMQRRSTISRRWVSAIHCGSRRACGTGFRASTAR